MATSYQIVGDRAQHFNDLDLLVVLHLMIRDADALRESQFQKLELVNYWRHVCETYGPGTIDLRLNALASDQSLKTFFLRLLEAVNSDSEAIGETYPAKLLMKEWLTPGVTVYEYKTELIRSTVENLRKLLEQ